MKPFLFFFAAVVLIVFAVSCSGGRQTRTTAAQVPVAIIEPTDIQLAQGKTLWETRCNKCHKLYLPVSRPQERWEKVLPRMYRLSKLQQEEAALVHAFILTNAKPGNS